MNVNNLSLNATKTKYIVFKSRNKKSKHDLKISINEENIKQVKNITFLGIVIDEFLTWRDHIDVISKKIIKSAAIISRIRHFTNLNSLKLNYYALRKNRFTITLPATKLFNCKFSPLNLRKFTYGVF